MGTARASIGAANHLLHREPDVFRMWYWDKVRDNDENAQVSIL